ncbi:MAG: hypothetical protein L0L68_00090 [Corynebacterium sp.]|nr:hypothetical protein [Corynebacterium sp.]
MNKERHWATRTCAAQMLIDIQTQNPKIPSPDFASPDKQNFPEFFDASVVSVDMPFG